MECIQIYALFVGLVIGWLVLYTVRQIRRAYRIPVPLDEQPDTPVMEDDHEH
jgi:hypothetical protein